MVPSCWQKLRRGGSWPIHAWPAPVQGASQEGLTSPSSAANVSKLFCLLESDKKTSIRVLLSAAVFVEQSMLGCCPAAVLSQSRPCYKRDSDALDIRLGCAMVM